MEKDRRKFKRFDAYMSVKCSVPNTEKTSNVALSKDLSRDGICVSGNQSLPKGEVLDIEIDIPDDPRPIRTTGKVVWAKSSKESDSVEHGIRFLTIDPIDKFRVLDYAYNHWLETKVNDYSDPEEISELN